MLYKQLSACGKFKFCFLELSAIFFQIVLIQGWLNLKVENSDSADCMHWCRYITHACYALSRFSHARLCAKPCTIACQAPLSMGFPRQKLLERVAMPPSRGSSQSRDWTLISYVSCTGRWVLYHKRHLFPDKWKSHCQVQIPAAPCASYWTSSLTGYASVFRP